MIRKSVLILCIGACLSMTVLVAQASSTFVAGLKRINFVTQNQNEVTIGIDDDNRVSDIEVWIHGIKIPISKSSYEDLVDPVLSHPVLASSVSIQDNHSDASYRLEFPLMDASKDGQDWNEMAIVSFLIENNRLMERDIYKDSTKDKVLSRIVY